MPNHTPQSDPATVRVHRKLIRLFSDDALTLTRADSERCLELADIEEDACPPELTYNSRVEHLSVIRAIDDERAFRATHGIEWPAPTFGFPQQFLDELKQRASIEDEIGLVVILRRHGRVLTGCCPLHDDADPSLSVWPDEGRWRCWAGCGYGDVIDWIQAFNPDLREFRKAVEYLSVRAGMELPRPPKANRATIIWGSGR